MKEIYVIAGNWKEYDEYRRKHLGDGNYYNYLDDTISLRGKRDPDGIFIGTWYEHHNFIPIIHALIASCDYHQTKREILKTVYHKYLDTYARELK